MPGELCGGDPTSSVHGAMKGHPQVIDLLNGGQGVFGIAVPGILRELAGDIVKFPSERIDGTPQVETIDELAERRNRRSS